MYRMPCTCLTKRNLNVQGRRFLILLTWKCASRLHGVHFFDVSTSKSAPKMRCFVHFDFEICCAPQWHAIFHLSSLAKWLHTRRFSEPTFRPSWATNHWKKHSDSSLSTFSRTYIFFLLTLSLLWSSCFFSALLWLFPPLLFHLSILSEV